MPFAAFSWLITCLTFLRRAVNVQYHPDVCKGEHCALKFKQVNNAYEVTPSFPILVCAETFLTQL